MKASRQQLSNRVFDLARIWDDFVFQDRAVSDQGIFHIHALDRRVQMKKSFISHKRGDICAPAAQPRRFFRDDQSAGPLHRSQDGRPVQRNQRPQVNNLGADPLLRQLLRASSARCNIC